MVEKYEEYEEYIEITDESNLQVETEIEVESSETPEEIVYYQEIDL
jgi:hypothetical protein